MINMNCGLTALSPMLIAQPTFYLMITVFSV